MENSHLGVACTDANTKLRLNDSTIHHNGMEGLYAEDHAVVDLHGTTTGVHSNKGDGIYAIDNAKVNIHLLSQHNTSHDNVGNNRFQQDGGSIDTTATHPRGCSNCPSRLHASSSPGAISPSTTTRTQWRRGQTVLTCKGGQWTPLPHCWQHLLPFHSTSTTKGLGKVSRSRISLRTNTVR